MQALGKYLEGISTDGAFPSAMGLFQQAEEEMESRNMRVDAMATFDMVVQAAKEQSEENGRLRAELTALRQQVREFLEALYEVTSVIMASDEKKMRLLVAEKALRKAAGGVA